MGAAGKGPQLVIVNGLKYLFSTTLPPVILSGEAC